MAIIASCGCEVFSGDDLIPVEWDDEEIDFDNACFTPVTIMAHYCRKCSEDSVSKYTAVNGFRISKGM